jgi:hypothetical protein
VGQQFTAAIGVRAPKQVAILHRFKFVRQFASEKSLDSERKQLPGLEKNWPLEYASGSGFIKHHLRMMCQRTVRRRFKAVSSISLSEK